LSTKQAEEAKKFNDQLDSLSKNSTDAARSLVGNLLPALNSVLESYIKLGGLKGTIAAVFGKDDLSQSESKAKAAAAAVTLASDRLASLSEQLKRDPGNEALGVIVEKQKAKVQLLIASANAASDALKGLADKTDPLKLDGGTNLFADAKPRLKVPDKAAGPGKDRKEQISDASRALAQYVEQLDKQLEKEQDLTETQKALNFLKTIGTTGEIPQVRELVINLAKKKEALDAELDVTKGLAEVEKERAKAQRDLDNQIDEFSGRTLDQKKRELGERLEERIKNGELFSPEELERMVKRIAGLSTQVQETESDMVKFTKSAAASINSTLGDSVSAALRGDFSSIGKMWENLLRNMVSQALAAKLSKALIGDATTTGEFGGLVGAFLKSFATKANGGAFGGTGAIPFAMGGVFDSPTLFRFANGGAMSAGVLGEAGPEAIMPLRRGRDGKLGVVAAAANDDGGDINITQYVTVGAGVSRAEVAQAMAAAKAEMKGELMQQRSRGTGVFR
jgi:phage-related minor tail protein